LVDKRGLPITLNGQKTVFAWEQMLHKLVAVWVEIWVQQKGSGSNPDGTHFWLGKALLPIALKDPPVGVAGSMAENGKGKRLALFEC